jgi:NADP-dependent 3-hydroxy acid dehydrogenase YdfG
MTQAIFAGLIHLTKALMAPMLARGHGKIVNNASIAAYVPFSGRRGLLGHQDRRGRLHVGAAT